MTTMASTPSGWRYWIEAPSAFRREVADPVIGTLVLRPVEGDDIAIELCPGYAAGQAAQDELRLRIREVPVTIRARAGGTTKKPKTVRYAWSFLKAIVATWLR